MPPTPDVLEVGAVIDLSQIVPGMDALAAKTEATAAQMNVAMASVGAAAIPINEGLDSISDKAELAGGELERNFVEARHAAILFGEESGVRVPRALAAVAARLPGLGTALELAFPIAVAAAFGQIIVEVIDKIEKAREKALNLDIGWSHVDNTFDSFDRSLQSKLDSESAKIAGLTGGPLAEMDEKIKAITFDVDTFYTHINSAFDQFAKQVQATENLGIWHFLKGAFSTQSDSEQQVIDKTKEFQLAYDRAGDSVSEKHRVIEKAMAEVVAKQKEIYDAAASVDKLRTGSLVPPDEVKRQQSLVDQYSRLLSMLERINAELYKGTELEDAQGKAAGLEKSTHIAELADKDKEARITAAQSVTEKLTSLRAKAATEEYAAGNVTLTAETNALIESENDRYAAVQTAFQRRRSILTEEASRGKEVSSEQIKLQGEVTTASVEHQQKLTEIAAAATQERKALVREQELFEIASIDRQVKAQTEAIVKEIEAERNYREAGAKFSESAALQEMEQTSRLAQQNMQLQSQRIAASIAPAMVKAHLEEDLQNQAIARERAAADEKLRIEKEYLDKVKGEILGGESQESFISNAGPADSERLAKLQTVNQQIETAQREHNFTMQTLEQRQVTVSQQTILKIQQSWMRGADSIASEYGRAFNQIANGTMTVANAFTSMGAHLVNQMALHVQEMVIKWAIGEMQMVLLHAIASRTKEATDDEAAAHSVAVSAASSLKKMAHYAAVAAGAAWSATAEIPIIGPILAPIAAAGAFAGVMGFEALAGAEHGALVPANMPIFAHEKEMILPRPLSEGLQGLIAGGPGGSSQAGNIGGDAYHNHFHIGSVSAANPADFVKQLKTLVRRGQLRT